MSKHQQTSSTNPETWVDTHGDALYRFALSRLRDAHAAENLVQETFLAALKSRAGFDGRSSERTWLIGILKHKIIDHMRSCYRETPITNLQSEDAAINNFFDDSEHLKKEPSGWIPDPKKIAENKEFWRTFEDCLNKLPKATADAFTLREVDSADTKEICKVLGISTTNLWVMLHRARLQLRQCLENNWFESGKAEHK